MSPPGLLVDHESFTRDGAVVRDRVPLARLGRLAGSVSGSRGEIGFVVRGSRDGDGGRWIDLEVSAVLVLQCQRCLESLDWPAELSNRLMLVAEGQDPDDLEEDAWDALPVGRMVDLLELVEDELLLALPAAPRHEDCMMPSPADGGEQVSPFAQLEKLRRADGD